MLDKNKAADIFGKIKKYSSADEIEVLVYGGHSALTRFANNTIHQNVAEENYVVSVRTAFDGRTARATTNKLDDESLKRVVTASEKLARVQHPDPDLLSMPEAGGGARSTQTSSLGAPPIRGLLGCGECSAASLHAFARSTLLDPKLEIVIACLPEGLRSVPALRFAIGRPPANHS